MSRILQFSNNNYAHDNNVLSFFAFRSDFVYDLFEHMSVSDQGGGGKRPTMMGKRGGKPSRKKTTVSSQFKVSTLMNHAIAGFNSGGLSSAKGEGGRGEGAFGISAVRPQTDPLQLLCYSSAPPPTIRKFSH